ncbi:TPA: DUF262 domain-containing protein [Proteus mirabilis]|nr:DUF262 domain-containing protein [Proteus mirabilis]
MLITKKKMKEMRNAASFDPTKKSHAASIQKLCQSIESEKLTIPVYQRNLSWTHEKAVELFNFQLNGKSAISAISIIEINNYVDNEDNNNVEKKGVKQLKFLTREPIRKRGRLETVIDGQQRLSTNYRAYIGDPEFDKIVLDLGTGDFKNIKDKKPTIKQIPVTKLLNKDSSVLIQYLQEKYSNDEFNEVYSLLVEIRTKLHTYSYTINVAEDLTFEEQKKWFEILNNAGTRVKGLQLALAEINENYTFDIYDYFVEFKKIILESSLSIKQLYTPLSTQDSYPMCALNPWYEVYFKQDHALNFAPFPSDAKPSYMVKLEQKDLVHITEKTLNSLKLALNFLREYNLFEKIERIDYVLYLIGYLAFNNDEIKNPSTIIHWIDNTDFIKKDNGERREIFNSLIKL